MVLHGPPRHPFVSTQRERRLISKSWLTRSKNFSKSIGESGRQGQKPQGQGRRRRRHPGRRRRWRSGSARRLARGTLPGDFLPAKDPRAHREHALERARHAAHAALCPFGALRRGSGPLVWPPAPFRGRPRPGSGR